MRLIDADVLQQHFEKVKKESEKLVDVAQIIGVQVVIDNQPTAYDVDRVIEQIRQIPENYSDNDLDSMIDDAVEIVREEIKG